MLIATVGRKGLGSNTVHDPVGLLDGRDGRVKESTESPRIVGGFGVETGAEGLEDLALD